MPAAGVSGATSPMSRPYTARMSTPGVPEDPLWTWHGDSRLKSEVLARVDGHRAANSFVQGVQFQLIDPTVATGYRGNILGAMVPLIGPGMPGCCGDDCRRHIDWHREVERRYGIPYLVALAMCDVFHMLTPQRCADFAVDVVQAIPVGVDLRALLHQIIVLRDYISADGVRMGGVQGPDGIACAEQYASELLEILTG